MFTLILQIERVNVASLIAKLIREKFIVILYSIVQANLMNTCTETGRKGVSIVELKGAIVVLGRLCESSRAKEILVITF